MPEIPAPMTMASYITGRRPLYRDDRFAFDRLRGLAVHADRHVANQRDAIELAVEVRIEDIPRREVRGGTVVPEGDAAGLPGKAHREFGADDVLPQELEQHLALARRHADDRLQERRAHEQGTLSGLRMHSHDRVLAHERALAHELPVL